MKIKKYEARTEQEAIEKVKEELGLSALILNIRKTQPKGIFALFRKPLVEVTAAYEEKGLKEKLEEAKLRQEKEAIQQAAREQLAQNAREMVHREDETEKSIQESANIQEEKIKQLEQKLSSTEDLLQRVINQLSVAEHTRSYERYRRYENNTVQIFYEALLEQGVTPEIAEKLLEDVDSIEESEKININLIVKIVYNTIIRIIGEPEVLRIGRKTSENPATIIFIGPTGVGKTTTIAKISSNFILKDNLRVGLITADTYRIAAVEQLKTYAEILGIEVGVVFNSEDLLDSYKGMKYLNDVILIDTAGRSHKNRSNLEELSALLEKLPDSEKFLVLSVTTRYEDLLSIIEAYSEIASFKIIFTKLDETMCLGSILNICYLTGKKVSYITNGQNVPDDIEIIQPDKIAKALLGLGSEVLYGSGQ